SRRRHTSFSRDWSSDVCSSDLLSERGNLASMLVDSGKAEQALPIALSVVEASTRVLGADDPRTLRAKLNLSSLYARLGRLDETRSEERRVGKECIAG